MSKWVRRRKGRKETFDWAMLSADLWRLARAYGVCTREDREDLCQAILLRLLRHGAMPRRNRDHWLSRVVANGIRDLIRCRREEEKHIDRRFSVDTLGLRQDMRIAEHLIEVAAPDGESERELRQSIWQAIERLPVPQRQVCALAFEGLKYDEIAQAIGAPIGTVRSRLHYAKLRLQADLTAER